MGLSDKLKIKTDLENEKLPESVFFLMVLSIEHDQSLFGLKSKSKTSIIENF